MTRKIVIDPGNVVVCDFCSEDYTDSDEQGGILYGSYAVCPTCAPKMKGRKGRLKATCPEGKSFADWVREDLR